METPKTFDELADSIKTLTRIPSGATLYYDSLEIAALLLTTKAIEVAFLNKWIKDNAIAVVYTDSLIKFSHKPSLIELRTQ